MLGERPGLGDTCRDTAWRAIGSYLRTGARNRPFSLRPFGSFESGPPNWQSSRQCDELRFWTLTGDLSG